jgi:hypothetical protein
LEKKKRKTKKSEETDMNLSVDPSAIVRMPISIWNGYWVSINLGDGNFKERINILRKAYSQGVVDG